MDEARAVMHRLERIEALEREGAGPKQLLAEVRELLREGEAWLETERDDTDLAAGGPQPCRRPHDPGARAGAQITPPGGRRSARAGGGPARGGRQGRRPSAPTPLG